MSSLIRKAILQAADHIERNPRDFNFWNNNVPSYCGTPGCALGWISFFSGKLAAKVGEGSAQHVGSQILGTNSGKFYERLDQLTNSRAWPQDGIRSWKNDAALCSHALRLYADERFPENTPNWEAIAARRTVLPQEVSEDVVIHQTF